MDLSILRRVAEEMIPFNKFLGMRVVSLEVGRIEMQIPWREELIGDWVKPALHGGVIGLRPGRSEALFAEARALRVGRSVGVADVRLFHESARGEVIASARGVYAIKTPRSAPPVLPQ
jgi:acyl-coenzyme A thioesterase PaaI-like protein